MDIVVEQFNNYFVNVGPDAATQIPDPGPADVNPDCLLERNPHWLFFTAVGEEEMTVIVKSCENKTSNVMELIELFSERFLI